jgi:hypothetical protein
MAVQNTTSFGAVFLPQHDNNRRVMLNAASIFLHQKRGRTFKLPNLHSRNFCQPAQNCRLLAAFP